MKRRILTRYRVANVVPVSCIIQSVGPPKTDQECELEREIPVCRLKPSHPKILGVFTASEICLIREGLDWLIKVHIRPYNASDISPVVRKALREYSKKKGEIALKFLESPVTDVDPKGGKSVQNHLSEPILGDAGVFLNVGSGDPFGLRRSSEDSTLLASSPSTIISTKRIPPMSNPSCGIRALSVHRRSPPHLFSLSNVSLNNGMEPYRTRKNLESSVAMSKEPLTPSSFELRPGGPQPFLPDSITNFDPCEIYENTNGLPNSSLFEVHIPYVPLRLFLNDWDERFDSMSCFPKLKQAICNLMYGVTKLNDLDTTTLGDVKMALSYMNLAQLVILRHAQPLSVNSCVTEVLRDLDAKLNDYVAEAFTDYVLTNHITPQIAAKQLTQIFPDPTPTNFNHPPADNGIKTLYTTVAGMSTMGGGHSSSSLQPSLLRFDVPTFTSIRVNTATEITSDDKELHEHLNYTSPKRSNNPHCEVNNDHRDYTRKVLVGVLPTLLALKASKRQVNTGVIKKINASREVLVGSRTSCMEELLRSIKAGNLRPKGTTAKVKYCSSGDQHADVGSSCINCLEKILSNKGEDATVTKAKAPCISLWWDPQERQWIGRHVLMILGAINSLKIENAQYLKSSVSWWFVSPRNVPSLQSVRFKSDQHLKNASFEGGVFVHFPSLMTRTEKPRNQVIYSMRMTMPSVFRAAPQPTDSIQWSILSLEVDADTRLLEPPQWTSVMDELAGVLEERSGARYKNVKALSTSNGNVTQ